MDASRARVIVFVDGDAHEVLLDRDKELTVMGLLVAMFPGRDVPVSGTTLPLKVGEFKEAKCDT